jgi:hypothetical protein
MSRGLRLDRLCDRLLGESTFGSRRGDDKAHQTQNRGLLERESRLQKCKTPLLSYDREQYKCKTNDQLWTLTQLATLETPFAAVQYADGPFARSGAETEQASRDKRRELLLLLARPIGEFHVAVEAARSEPDARNRFYAKRAARQKAFAGLSAARAALSGVWTHENRAALSGSAHEQWIAPAANGLMALVADAVIDKLVWTHENRDLGCAALAGAEVGMYVQTTTKWKGQPVQRKSPIAEFVPKLEAALGAELGELELELRGRQRAGTSTRVGHSV